MFTGIIQAKGAVLERQIHDDGDSTLHIDASALGTEFEMGESISTNGVCLTVVGIYDQHLAFDVSNETLGLTSLGLLQTGAPVNLERAATPKTALGGHIVSGHVDGLAEVVAREADARSVRFLFEVPAALARYLAPKGSVCLDGVSLTVNDVEGARFDVNIVPHTMSETLFDTYAVGALVNLEVDVLARYVERLLDARESDQS